MNEALSTLQQQLQTANNDELRLLCADLIAKGTDYKEIIQSIFSAVSGHAVADTSWLPTASVINVSDSLVHVPLQLDGNKHLMMVMGERRPPFRRIESPQRIAGSVEELQVRFEEASLGNDWELGERCLLGIADEVGIEKVFDTLLETLLQPRYLGSTSGPWWAGVRHLLIGGMIDLWQAFGEDAILKVADEKTALAIEELTSQYRELNIFFGDEELLPEQSFREEVGSGDLKVAFDAVSRSSQIGVSIQQIDLALQCCVWNACFAERTETMRTGTI